MSLLVSFEGGEATGKSYQIEAVANELKSHFNVTTFREPGGTPKAEAIRKLIFECNFHYNTNLPLYWAARMELIQDGIRPALERGDIVLLDRYYDSTNAYQLADIPEDDSKSVLLQMKLLHAFEDNIITPELVPDVTFLLDADPEVTLKRLEDRQTLEMYDSAKIEFHKGVRENYLAITRGEPERFHVVDATLPKHTVRDEILNVIKAKLQ